MGGLINGARWSSGRAFDSISTGSWFKSYTGITEISQVTRNESSPRLHSTKV